MPGPAIYVVVAITTVAAAYAFKEYVYEPHLREKMHAWRESILEERKQRRARARRGAPIAVPISTHTASDVSDDDDVRIELEQMVSGEVEAWRTGVLHGDAAGLRQRTARGAATHLLDADEHAHLGPPPLVPSRGDSPHDILFEDPQANAYPSPDASAQGDRGGHAVWQDARRAPSATPTLHSPTRSHASESTLDSDLLAFTSPVLSAAPRSPLSDMRSPQSEISDLPSDMDLQSSAGSDEEMFTVPSHLSSSDAASVRDDDFDHVSEASSWTGINASSHR